MMDEFSGKERFGEFPQDLTRTADRAELGAPYFNSTTAGPTGIGAGAGSGLDCSDLFEIDAKLIHFPIWR